MKIRWIFAGLGILAILGLVWLTYGQTGQKNLRVTWDKYGDYGSDDVAGFMLYEVTRTGQAIRNINPRTSPIPDKTNVQYDFSIPADGQEHFFAMTAVDLAGNESVLSNIDSVLVGVIEVRGFKVWKR